MPSPERRFGQDLLQRVLPDRNRRGAPQPAPPRAALKIVSKGLPQGESFEFETILPGPSVFRTCFRSIRLTWPCLIPDLPPVIGRAFFMAALTGKFGQVRERSGKAAVCWIQNGRSNLDEFIHVFYARKIFPNQPETKQSGNVNGISQLAPNSVSNKAGNSLG